MGDMVLNRPTPEGRTIGDQLARLTEKAAAKLAKGFPNQRQPCESCAFRRGTIPNGCFPTVMDAIKCVMENRIFYCHQHFDKDGNPDTPCAGYMIAISALSDAEPMDCPWDYSE